MTAFSSASRRRLLRRIPLAIAVAAIVFGWIGLNLEGIYFRDTLAYWRPNFDDLYGDRHVGVLSTYLYSPAFAQLMWPLGLLPWSAFAAAWSALNLGVLVWLVGPYLAAVLFLVPGPVADEISTGNIHLLLAAAIVVGFRAPAAWAFPLLTKVTPGIAILWFVGARRWRPLAFGLGASAAIAALSFAAVPSAWVEWIETLRRSSEVPVTGAVAVIPGPLWLRTALAAAIALVAGAAGQRWLVPVAATLALPVLWSSGLSLLVASLALTRDRWGQLFTRAREAFPGVTSFSENRRQMLAGVAFVSIVLVMVAVPLTALLETRPVRFGWQMYSTLNRPPEAWIEAEGGTLRPVDVMALIADPRSEIRWSQPLAAVLCERRGTIAVVVSDRDGRTRTQCS